MLPNVLGDRGLGSRQGVSAAERLPNLRADEDRVGLQQWLAANEPVLYEALNGGEDTVVLDDLQEASERLGVPDIAMHAARIRRSVHEDPAQAIGSAKGQIAQLLARSVARRGLVGSTLAGVPAQPISASERAQHIPVEDSVAPRKTVRYGSRGPDVEYAQDRLNAHGAQPPLVVDGIFGPLTRGATRSYQHDHGLDADGVIGRRTWRRSRARR